MRNRVLQAVATMILALAGAVGLPAVAAHAAVTPEGPYEIMGIGSHKCIDVPHGTFDNVQLQIYTCKESGNQLFWALEVYSGQWQIYSIQTGKCLTVLNARDNDNQPIIQYDCNLGLNELWSFPSGTHTIKNVKSKKCLTVKNNGTANGALLLQFTCNGGNNQIWTFGRDLGPV
ncbi:RICIN domain-containing protein [Dactylosporangium sp. CS-047395]|uniref:RICIN domain-containing protein n=1 Tax=Dactylosporangium sp. CS-047395 TaxID=3239936 RepID=UPI003D9309E8